MRFTFVVLILMLSACGGGNSKSSNPPPQQPPEKVVVEVVLNAVDEVLEEGDQFQLTAAARDENGQTIEGKTITWRSLKTGVVTVSDSGLVTAHASGIASVEAKIDDVTAKCDFEVIGTYTYQLMYNKTQFAVLSNIHALDIGDAQAEPQLLLEQTEFSYVSHASASQNGEMIAFVVREESESATLNNIYIANRDGSNAQRLTFNNLRNTEPAWSPDGNRIAFSGHVSSEEVNIWSIDIDGNNAVNLTEDLHGGIHKSPSWSPCFEGGSCRIAYSSLTDSGVRIWSMLDDGNDKQQLTSGDQVHDSEPAWSPDGSTIVFIRNAANIVSDLYIVPAEGGDAEPLIQQNLDYGEFSPVWSPDGSMIAFTSDHENSEYLQIWTVWADGTNLVKRTTDSKDHFNPGWLPL